MNNTQSIRENIENKQEDLVEITFYTDPLCCWSWAFEPQWRRLRYEFAGKIRWRYCMGGLLPDWNTFNDPLNSVSRPQQMGPLWMEAKHISGMPIQHSVWVENPPKSSFPACIAVKCATLQSADATEAYLRRCREAVMLDGKNIAEQQVLLGIANELARERPQLLDAERFQKDWKTGAGKETFREDLQAVKLHNFGRFPTLTIQQPGKPGVVIVGYRPYEVLLEALKQVAPKMKPTQKASEPEEYRNYWGSVTERELEEALATEAR